MPTETDAELIAGYYLPERTDTDTWETNLKLIKNARNPILDKEWPVEVDPE